MRVTRPFSSLSLSVCLHRELGGSDPESMDACQEHVDAKVQLPFECVTVLYNTFHGEKTRGDNVLLMNYTM